MLGCTPVTTRLIRSTTDEKSKSRVYCVWACCWNSWSSEAAVKACSTVARAMTLRGLSARNGVKIWSSSMACPPGRPACYLLSFQHLTTHQAGAKGLRQATLEGVVGGTDAALDVGDHQAQQVDHGGEEQVA